MTEVCPIAGARLADFSVLRVRRRSVLPEEQRVESVMVVRGLLVGLLLLMPTGCFFFQPQGATSFNGSVADTVSELLQARVVPPITAGRVRVRFVNDSGSAADTRVTMRVDGQLVHRSERRLSPFSELLSPGPDQADTVVVEVTLTAPVARSLPIATFRLGADFRPGDEITITIPADPVPTIAIDGLDEDVQVDPGALVEFNVLTNDAGDSATVSVFADADNDPDNGNELSIAEGLAAAATIPIVWDTAGAAPALYEIYAELVDGDDVIRTGPAVGRVRIIESAPPEPPPPSPTIAIVGLDQDARINAGTRVAFDIVTTNAGSAAEVRVIADPDVDPENGNELIIGDRLAATALIEFIWNTTGVAPATYSIYAELNDVAGIVRTGPAAGRVRINSEPQFSFVTPRENLIVTLGRSFVVSWAAGDDDDDASIRIFLDRNTDVSDGIEVLLAEGISEDDIGNRELTVDTSEFDPQLEEIFVGAEISDGLSTLVVYTGRVCLTPRLVGRFTPSMLAAGDITILRGGEMNAALGASLDLTGSFDGDPHADLLIGDPLAWDELAQTRPGAAFVRSGAGDWPRELTIDDMDVTFFGERHDSRAGERVALLRRSRINGTRDILIGAPRLFEFAGRGYRIDGFSIELGTVVGLDSIFPFQSSRNDPPPRPGATGSTVTGSLSEQTGLDASALGDLDGDGTADYALGGAGQFDEENAGRVVIISGDAVFLEISTNDVGASPQIRGAHAFGSSPDALTGHAIRSLSDIDNDGDDELLISAPVAGDGKGEAPGVVYMIHGRRDILASPAASIALDEIGFGNGVRFVGENDGDLAGAALATGNFDGVGGDDLLIGAPGYDNARGRVYLMLDMASLPPIVELADVGGAIPGVIFEGMAAGDQLGVSLANAGDTDGDLIDDMLIGAPGVQGQLGAAFLIYGGQMLARVTTLFEMPSCDNLQGWQLTGDVELARLGAAVSGGGNINPNIDPFAEVAIGAPGDPTLGSSTGGTVYLIFGHGQIPE